MLEVHELAKHYGATVAVSKATFGCRAGTVHALLGENGAGKSTLVKMLSGAVRPDAGAVRIDGADLHFGTPWDARRAGIGTAFQELGLIPFMTVAQNLLLGEEPQHGGFVRRLELNEKAMELLSRHGIAGIDPERPVHLLALSEQQKIEIVKAIHRASNVCILDEPTSALTASDVDWFSDRVVGLKRAGVSVIFITHRLQEVRELCDEVTVLRRGATEGTYPVEAISDDELVAKMLGEPLHSAFPPRPEIRTSSSSPVLLSSSDLRRGPRLRGVCLEVRAGEIVGVAALQGQGQEDLFRAFFGIVRPDSGSVRVGGKTVRLRHPRDAIRAGISYVPESRKTEGLFLHLSGTENLTIASLGQISYAGWIFRRREREAVWSAVRRLQISPQAGYEAVAALSGGNQQKVVIGKWLLRGARIMLMYDPTRGVDIGTKREIYGLMREHAKSGGGLLWYSTDVLELVGVCDRILVIYDGRVVEEFDTAIAAPEEILASMLGRRRQEKGA